MQLCSTGFPVGFRVTAFQARFTTLMVSRCRGACASLRHLEERNFTSTISKLSRPAVSTPHPRLIGRFERTDRSLAKYVVSPPISLRRILAYDGQQVRYWYNDHKTKRRQEETIPALVFIGRMVQHILPKGFHRIRYYGLHATCKAKKVRGVLKQLRWPWAERSKRRTGSSPARPTASG
jgi:Putative transposase